jgi:uncharacterized protein YegL|tara:strand:+ start:205 stop:435 length:231 start_codon:yes stop_codon:yes gene_type:complete
MNLEKGDNDLEKIIENLKSRVKDLEQINESHQKLNSELRKEVYALQMKNHAIVNLENQIEVQKGIIKDLSKSISKL